MNTFKTLEYLIIPEIKTIRIKDRTDELYDLLIELNKNNIKGKVITETHLSGNFIEFETPADLLIFKLKFDNVKKSWSRQIIAYYENDYDLFKRKMIEYLKNIKRNNEQ